MNRKKLLASVMSIACAIGCTSVPAFAAPQDIIDDSKTGSITVTKFDETTASIPEADGGGGIDLAKFYTDHPATGLRDTDAEDAMADYVVQGVEFTYFKVADIKTHTKYGGYDEPSPGTLEGEPGIEVIYGLEKDLETVLGLTTADAVETRGEGADAVDYFTSDQLNAKLAALLAGEISSINNENGKNALEDWITTDTHTTTKGSAVTNANGQVKFDELPVGLYLIVETKVPETIFNTVNPFFVSIPSTKADGSEWFYDLFVYPKNQSQIPTIEKKTAVDDDRVYKDMATASEGEIVDYNIVTMIPEKTSKASYFTEYYIEDHMCKYAEYIQDSVKVAFYDTEAHAFGTNAETRSTGLLDITFEKGADKDYTVTFETQTDGSTKMKVVPTAAGLAKLNSTSKETGKVIDKAYMSVTYDVRVKSSADVILGDQGNRNEATLFWKRTNTDYEQNIKDVVDVFSFGLNMKKNFSDGNGDPTAVQFTVKNIEDENNSFYVRAVPAKDKQGEVIPGVYYVAETSPENPDYSSEAARERAEATADSTWKYSPDSNGTLKIYGLEADKYEVKEIQTDAGYSLLRDTIIVDITCTDKTYDAEDADDIGVPGKNQTYKVVDVANAYATVDTTAAGMSTDVNVSASTNANVDMQIMNTKTFLLPQTGGQGMIAVVIAGVGVAVVATFLILRKRRDEE